MIEERYFIIMAYDGGSAVRTTTFSIAEVLTQYGSQNQLPIRCLFVWSANDNDNPLSQSIVLADRVSIYISNWYFLIVYVFELIYLLTIFLSISWPMGTSIKKFSIAVIPIGQ